MIEQIIFYALAAIIAICSVLAVTTRKIIRSATYLLFVLLSTAGIYLLLSYHFLAMVQIAVYAGGVMVLFIFSILLTHQPGVDVQFEKPGRMVLSGLAALAGLGLCGHIIYHNVEKVYQYVDFGEIEMTKIGFALMGTDKYQYLLPFEAVSLLLLACIIGAIMIARKR
ncbi:NADH-quinone oxidoreductase subunit J [Dysgonomonas sp. PH5-45]|uniref:NADH-quinone oxidoreductase subunit J family protein n=1 Tax=unclassified Dysgonomonas TaxID=2630389 RepID=UPI00247595D7|nr:MULTISPECIES: NADH-quinone oxidoreductase subunit J [unclassified Dysgonomonas]MDH6355746.1 NADH-quinone oxidoreductase subunit J [Dysgonomonas sp. PH5-45]MDH6388643.1 NADH-quinone oxidoreductase subunit J [Dysgonomonas sp. PH5-37]